MTWAYLVAAVLAIFVIATPSEEGFTSLSWTERKLRGHSNFKQYPPCYDICGATRTIYDLLQKAGRIDAHQRLLDAYSIVLCQEKEMEEACASGSIVRRINELPPLVDAHSERIVALYNPKASGLAKEFLLRITDVLEDNFQLVMNDASLSKDTKDTLERMHKTFFEVHFPKIQGC